jgi:hypothetical protein
MNSVIRILIAVGFMTVPILISNHYRPEFTQELVYWIYGGVIFMAGARLLWAERDAGQSPQQSGPPRISMENLAAMQQHYAMQQQMGPASQDPDEPRDISQIFRGKI